MSGEEEDIRLPDDQTLVATVLVTTVPIITEAPVTMAPTMLPALPEYRPLDLGGIKSHISGTRWKTGGGYQWSMIDSNTQESWLLTLKPAWESRYKLIQTVEETVIGILAIVSQVV
ncbi:UNVERIFIED_CONTAM: hypothetical protein K2H54_004269 [Gekko kuhli]